jgi:hypothetical protein
MRAASIAKIAAFFAVVVCTPDTSPAQTLIDSDFSNGDYGTLGWSSTGEWDVFTYPSGAAANPGRVARFSADMRDGSLTKTLNEIKALTNRRPVGVCIRDRNGQGESYSAATAVARSSEAPEIPLSTPDTPASLDDRGSLSRLIRDDVRAVAVGESARGVYEFYALQHRIIQIHVERMSLSAHIWEPGIPAGFMVDHWIHG